MNGGATTTIRRRLAMLVVALILNGCAGLPPLKPLDPSLLPATISACRKPFLTQEMRLVHAVTAVMPGGRESEAIGILSADPRSGHFRSVLMTLEGFVLFDIESGETPTVHRTVPPFHAPAFAQRMAEDIRLAFFTPGEPTLSLGTEAGGARVCRYGRPGGETVDVAVEAGGATEIRLYGSGQEPRKRVRIRRWNESGLADEWEILGDGWPSYGLKLRLIEAEAIAKD